MIIETIVTTMDAAGAINIAPMGVDWTGGDDAPVLKPFLETVTYRNVSATGVAVVNLIATVLKFGDRTQLGATHLATSLVASFQLLAASMVWVWRLYVTGLPVNGEVISVVVSLSGGALLANVFSVILLIGETLRQGR